MSSFDKYFLSVCFVALVLTAAFVTLVGCATTRQEIRIETCDAYIERVAKARLVGGGKVANAAVEVTKDGVVLIIQIVNEGKVFAEVLVDTPTLARRAEEKGMKPAGECERGGKTWQAFSAN
jgi:hypothetical protein